MGQAKQLFISHANKDKEVVEAFADFIRLGTNLSGNEIFCSSLEGMGIPPSKDFVNWIKNQIQNTKLAIFMISPSFLSSRFCLCELGATWALMNDHIPLLIPPATYSDLDGVLTGMHVGNISEENTLQQLGQIIYQKLELEINLPLWGNNVNKFMKKIPDLLKNVTQPEIISLKEHETLREQYNQMVQENSNYENEIKALEQKLKEMAAAKSKEEVDKILMPNDEIQSFEHLINQYKEEIKKLSRSTKWAFFEYPKDYFPGMGYAKDNAVEAAKFKELIHHTDIGDFFSLNEDHPPVKRAITKHRELSSFLEYHNRPDSNFDIYFTKKHDYHPEMDNINLWHDYNLLP